MSPLPQVCVLAGGLGTRLGEATKTQPKALMPVAGHPFLWHQLALLASYGAEQVVLCVGHLGEQIQETIGQNLHGLSIAYSYDQPGLNGTLGAIRRAKDLLEDRFLVLYGDTYLRLPYDQVVSLWIESDLPALMTVLHNEGALGASNAHFAEERVLAYDKFSPSSDMAYIDYGLGGLTKPCLSMVDRSASDLAELYHVLADEGLLYGYQALERFYEIGSSEGLSETDEFLRTLNSQN